MKLYTVWKKIGFSNHNEKCLMNNNGDYVGQKTGKIYPKEDYYHSAQLKGRIIAVDEDNQTGMYHLDKELSSINEENNKSTKNKYIGCEVTLEAAHWCGDIRVYRCLELTEYFSDKEVEIIQE